MENPEDEKTEPGEQFDLNKFLETPEVQKAIPRLVDLWNKHVEMKEKAAKGANTRFLILAVIIFVVTVVSVTLLTIYNKISSEGTSFLLGVIITGAISIIRDFTSGRE